MSKTISAYEAPALIDAHGGMTRLALYERLAGKSESAPRAGLAASIAGSVVEFSAEANGWQKPVRHDKRFDALEGSDLQGYARYWATKDGEGDFIVTFIHVAAFLFSSLWRRAGMPPADYIIQAQWAMMASGATRLAVVALADKTPEIFWVDRDEAIIATLRAGIVDMNRRLLSGDPPPVDSETSTTPPEPSAAESETASKADPDQVSARYRAAKLGRRDARTSVQFADHEYEVAEKALLAVIAPGASHEYDGFRLTRNAKNDRITEEKIDGLYF